MLLVGIRKRVRNAGFWVDDQGSVNSCPEPRYMSVPKEGALLLNHGELIGEGLAGLNGALCHIGRAIKPAR